MQQNVPNNGPRGAGGVRISLTAGGPLVEAQFSARPHAALIEAIAFGRLVRAHISETPAIRGLLRPGTALLLAPREEPPRKPAYQVVAVQQGDDWISLDDQLASRLVAAALAQAALPQFARYAKLSRDVQLGNQQIGFRLSEGLLSCLLEVRATSRVSGRVACYPEEQHDRRLAAQLELMTAVARTGQRAALIFIVQRAAGAAFAPADDIDDALGRALRVARSSGVEVYAYRCPVSPAGICLGDDLPVYASREAIPTSRWEP